MFYPLDQTPVTGNYLIEDLTDNTQGTVTNTNNGLPQLSAGAAAYSSNGWDFSANEAHIMTTSN